MPARSETKPQDAPGGRTLRRTVLAGVGATAILLGGCTSDERGPRASDGQNPDVILILIDTLRADHLGAYGYDRDVSPAIDAFARKATVFENAIAQAPHTIPSVLQIMTSRYAQGLTIAGEDRTLAETMQAAGYETVAIVENANFEFSRDPHGLMRGFDTFYRNGLLHPGDLEQQHWKSSTPADAITAQAIRWLKQRDRKRPFFLWLHYFDPHDPYLPPFAEDMEELSWPPDTDYTGDVRRTSLYSPGRYPPDDDFGDADRQHLIRLYDAEIRYVDQSLGELFEFLASQGIFEDAVIVLSADHGESFGEHDVWTHGRSLWDPEIHVPLIVKSPDFPPGKRIPDPVQAIDIYPTITAAAGVPHVGELDGTRLQVRPRDAAFAFWKDWQVVRTEDWKLVQQEEQRWLFAIASDPEELEDLASSRDDVVRHLVAARAAKLEEVAASLEELAEISSEAVERMRSIGYLD